MKIVSSEFFSSISHEISQQVISDTNDLAISRAVLYLKDNKKSKHSEIMSEGKMEDTNVTDLEN